MDDEKKSGRSWEERTQLGPYQLEEQMPQSAHSQGELYRARHEESGATALVFKPAAEEDVALMKDWRVRIISSIAPSYIALEVEDSQWAVAPDKHSADALVFLFAVMPELQEPRWGKSREERAAEAERINQRLGALYRAAGFQVIDVGPGTVEERAEFLASRARLSGAAHHA